MTNFNNPIPVSANEFTDMLSISAFAETEQGQEIENGLDFNTEPNPNPNPNPEVKVEEQKPLEGEEEGEDIKLETGAKIENDLDLNLNANPNSKEDVQVSNVEAIIDSLADRGFIVEPYEGFQDDEINEESLAKLLEHNLGKQIDAGILDFVNPLSDYTKRIIEFDINSKGKGVEQYLNTLIEEQNIKGLSVDNEYDQEKIVRQWYSRKENYTQSELEEKITELKDAGLLEKESKRIKPKLDDEAANIAKEKEEEQRQLRETENQVKEVYNKRVIDTLKTGKIGGITLNKEDAGSLYSILTGDETIEMTLPNKQKAMMSPLDAHIFYNKYAKEGSLERLALAALLLTNPKKFEEEYSKKIETKVTNTFVQEHKYNNAVKGGKVDTRPETKKESWTQKNKDAKWPLKVK